ncbi:MAG: VWA domain-containing protein, partial [Cellvibrionales bacterium]|nr:VWA domain-containing protein [Cellvibrionales bacterium]
NTLGSNRNDQDQSPSGDTNGDNGDQPASSPSALAQAASGSNELSELLELSLVRALQTGDEATLSVAIEAAAREAEVDNIRLFTQRGQYTRRLLDALGETELRDAAILLEQDNPAAFHELQELRERLRLRARDRVERAYLVHASGDTEEFLDNTLAQVKLANISPHQMMRMRKLIERMARKLASRHGRQRKRWKTVQRRRPQVMAICDVSGSVAAYAKFLLMFLYAVQDVLPRTRSFAFSSTLGEVTDWFEAMPVEEAVNAVNRTYGGATDYARAFQDFADQALMDIHSATTVIILGDARNNNSDPRLDLLAEIKSRCKRLIWLNPEPRVAWGSGDSAMLPVIRHCHLATECNNLKQLERIVDKLLADSRR